MAEKKETRKQIAKKHVEIDEKTKLVTFTEEGVKKILRVEKFEKIYVVK